MLKIFLGIESHLTSLSEITFETPLEEASNFAISNKCIWDRWKNAYIWRPHELVIAWWKTTVQRAETELQERTVAENQETIRENLQTVEQA
jgi:hypothetical protein